MRGHIRVEQTIDMVPQKQKSMSKLWVGYKEFFISKYILFYSFKRNVMRLLIMNEHSYNECAF